MSPHSSSPCKRQQLCIADVFERPLLLAISSGYAVQISIPLRGFRTRTLWRQHNDFSILSSSNPRKGGDGDTTSFSIRPPNSSRDNGAYRPAMQWSKSHDWFHLCVSPHSNHVNHVSYDVITTPTWIVASLHTQMQSHPSRVVKNKDLIAITGL